MRTITSLQPSDDFTLKVKFNNGSEKTVDIKPYLHLPVFQALTAPGIFKQVTNKGYFIEWTDLEIDLSADTLWHDGK